MTMISKGRKQCQKDSLCAVIKERWKLQTTSAPIHCLYSAKAVPMNGAPSSNADKAAFRRSAGKCAASMAAENCTSCRKSIRTPRHIKIWSRRIFCAAIFCRYWTCTFSCRNNQAIGLRLSAFSPSYIVLLNVAKLVIFCELYKYLLRKKTDKNWQNPTNTDKTRQCQK